MDFKFPGNLLVQRHNSYEQLATPFLAGFKIAIYHFIFFFFFCAELLFLKVILNN